METSFYDYESRSIPPRLYSGGHGGGVLMTELAMFAGHHRLGGAGSLATSWPFDCYPKRSGAPPAATAGLGVPVGAFSIDCLLTGRHGVDDSGLQLRPSADNLNLLHIGKLSRNTDIDGQCRYRTSTPF